jgi:hypothetical protein
MAVIGQYDSAEQSKMIFVVGSSRSGTTMLARILGRNDSVFMFYELHFFEELYHPQSKDNPLSSEQACDLAALLLARQRNGYFSPGDVASFSGEAQGLVKRLPDTISSLHVFASVLKYEALRNGKTIPVEQTPRNVFYLREILDRYPQALVVNIVRDARDVLLSQKLKWRHFWDNPRVPRSQCVRFWANYHPITISALWNSSINSADRYKLHPRTFRVRYEDILETPEKCIAEICSFVGISFSSDMLQISHLGSSHTVDDTVPSGINKAAGQRWRRDLHNRYDLAICQHLTRCNLVKHGYELSPKLSLRPTDVGRTVLTWPGKTILALLLNAGRTRNVFRAVKKRLLTDR